MKTNTYILIFISLLPYLSVSSSDTEILLSFKSSLSSSQNPLQDWSPSSSLSPCNFTGILCSQKNRVSSVSLNSIPLLTDFQSLSNTLFTLPNLLSISLKNTGLYGSVSSLYKTKCSPVLASVDLSENKLNGALSSFESCPGIKNLSLSSNLFDFTNDFAIKNLQNLEVLNMSYNKIYGDKVIESLFSSGCGAITSLSLKGNKISGEIPIKGCERLELLDLSANNFSSIFPNLGSCSVLTHLDLSSNKLSGNPFASLSSCKGLKFLNLTNNNLSGEVPAISLPLKYFYLSDNHFHGEIPATISGSNCSELIELDLSGNELSGVIPESLSSCSVLESINLSSNNFSGVFPIDVVTNLSNLKNLVLRFNNFSSGLPQNLSDLTNLEILDLSSNSLFGSIPKTLCEKTQSKLRVLYLQNNMFNGPIPESLSSCTNLVSLDLSFNYLNGTIPSSLGSLSNLRDMMMWLNELEGEIPNELSNIESLENLILDFNELSGTIPSSLSKCTNLNWISISNNKLTGHLPSSLGNLTDLAILKLGNNSISGQIPSELGDCSSLVWLDLNTNFLNGSIPPALFKQSGRISLRLLTGKQYVYIKNDGSRECHGAGNLLEFGGIRQENLNRISTRHPCNFTRVYRDITLPTFHNGSMILLDLSNNMLEGSIPNEIGSMYYLSVLNLGHNNLSGVIPQELGAMKMLGILDISYNRLSGTIPHTMSGLAFLGEFDISNNNISGLIPQTAPFDTFPDFKFFNNSGLCGYPLPACASDSSENSNNRQGLRKSKNTFFPLSYIIPMTVVVLIAGALLYVYHTHRRNNLPQNPERAFHEQIMISFHELSHGTNGFSEANFLGSGGFGKVYKGILFDGTIVAVKLLNLAVDGAVKSFDAECKVLRTVRHRNLVKVISTCTNPDLRALILEYIPNGSLEKWLYSHNYCLSFLQRVNIMIDVAVALDYLHFGQSEQVIHCDLKPSNVLLDEDMVAHVSDFGIAKILAANKDETLTRTLGSFGYIAPECGAEGRVSTRGDTFSFGIMLLETFTRKRPTDDMFSEDLSLRQWVSSSVDEGILIVVDENLLNENVQKNSFISFQGNLLAILELGLGCSRDSPKERFETKDVIAKLNKIKLRIISEEGH